MKKLHLAMNKIWYQILGPTTRHFELEVYLWLASLLLTISSWQGLYKEFPPLRLLLIVGIASFRPVVSRWYISFYNPRFLSAGHVMEVTEVATLTSWSNYWTRYWPPWMPPLPAFPTILSISILLFYVRAYWNLEERDEDTMIAWNLLAMEHRPDSNLPGPAGYYSTERPHWKHVFFYFTFGGIVGSILVFGRILPPLPDFVAGSTVYQTIKSTSHKQTPSPPVTGPERFRPVTNCDRLELHLKLILLRLLENICLCGWLPRTEWMQQFIRQRNTVIDLKYFLFFAGVTEPRRKDIPNPESDAFSALWVYTSLFSATVFLLVAQSLFTDRSYLSTLAFWSTEWKFVEPQHPQAPLWDARHKYKPGDVCNYNNLTYQAVLHHPQGPPKRRSTRWLERLYQWVEAEVGHGVMYSSRIWSELLRVQSTFVVTFLILWCFTSASWSSGLGTALLAHFVVWYGLVQVGATDYESLQKLANEVQVNFENNVKDS